MKQRVTIAIIFLLSVPFFLMVYPPTAAAFPTVQDKMSLIQFFLGVYGFFVGMIAVYEYVVRHGNHIDPELLLNGRSRVLAIKSGKFPFHVELEFYTANNGNISIEKQGMNYTILVPRDIAVHAKDGIKNDAGKMVIPNVREYEFNKAYHALGGEVPVKVYPQRQRRIFLLGMTFDRPGTYVMYYYFTTDHGLFPAGIKLDTNHEPVKNLGKLVLKVS